MSKRVKNEEQYEALRDKGYSKEKSARIANSEQSGEHGGRAVPYEERTKEELYELARQIELDGRSKMTKKELISALRDQ